MWLWRQFLILVLVLHTVHAPILVPDLDGECRGAPIHSLIESQAWHPIMLGVRPNDDVDRGPIRTDESESGFDFSPFGEFTSNQGRPLTSSIPWAVALSSVPDDCWPVNFCSATRLDRASEARQIHGSRTVAVHFCRWQV